MKHARPPEAAGTATKIARSNCLSNLTRARSSSRRTRRRTSTKCLHSYHCRHPHIAQTFSIAPHEGPCPTLLSSLIKMRVRKVGEPVKFASRLTTSGPNCNHRRASQDTPQTRMSPKLGRHLPGKVCKQFLHIARGCRTHSMNGNCTYVAA